MKADSKKAKSCSGNLSRQCHSASRPEFDNEAVQQEAEDQDESHATKPDGILSAVAKVMFFLFLPSKYKTLINFSYKKSYEVYAPAHNAAKIGTKEFMLQ